MQARIRPRDRVSVRAKAAVEEYVEERLREESTDVTRRLFKIAIIALNEDFGFGKARLMRFVSSMENAMQTWHKNEEYWRDVDARCRQIGMDLPDEDYDVMARRWADEHRRR